MTPRLTKTAPNIILDFVRRTAEVKDLVVTLLVALSHVKTYIVRYHLETPARKASRAEVTISDFCIPKHASEYAHIVNAIMQADIKTPVYVQVAVGAITSTRTMMAVIRILKQATPPAIHNVATI